MADRTPLTFEDLEFQNGKLVKIRGQRHQYMNGGDTLIFVASELGRMLYNRQQALSLATIGLSKLEPPDSRAVSDQFVALAAVQCDVDNAEAMEIIETALKKAREDD